MCTMERNIQSVVSFVVTRKFYRRLGALRLTTGFREVRTFCARSLSQRKGRSQTKFGQPFPPNCADQIFNNKCARSPICCNKNELLVRWQNTVRRIELQVMNKGLCKKKRDSTAVLLIDLLLNFHSDKHNKNFTLYTRRFSVQKK